MSVQVPDTSGGCRGARSARHWRRIALPALAIVVASAHLLAGHEAAGVTHGKLFRGVVYPLFIASRWSAGLTRFVRWHGGWPAAVAESVGVGVAALVALLGYQWIQSKRSSNLKRA
jgi:hypothetical protein